MKVALMFISFAALSILITSFYVVNGMEPWQYFMANVMAGAILGFVTGLKK